MLLEIFKLIMIVVSNEILLALVSLQVQSKFPSLSSVSSVNELVEKLKVIGPDIANLLHLAEKRQKVSSFPCQVITMVTGGIGC